MSLILSRWRVSLEANQKKCLRHSVLSLKFPFSFRLSKANSYLWGSAVIRLRLLSVTLWLSLHLKFRDFFCQVWTVTEIEAGQLHMSCQHSRVKLLSKSKLSPTVCSKNLKTNVNDLYKWIYERSYIWIAEKDMKAWLIIAVIHTT